MTESTVHRGSPLDRPARGLSVVFVRYDRKKYVGVWSRLRAHLKGIAPGASETVIVDNAAPGRETRSLEDGVHVIGGDNGAWEFSAFDAGVDWLRSRGRLRDLTLLVTDAYGAYGDDFLALVDASVLRYCRRHRAAAGWEDSFMEPFRLFESVYQAWFRTSYLLLPSEALARVRPFAWSLPDDRIFDADWRRRWKRGAPLSLNLERRIDHWLVRSKDDRTLADAETWHSRFELDESTFSFFKAKVRAILREHYLSIRLNAAGIPGYDLRVLSDRLVRGELPPADGSDESLRGLRTLFSRRESRQGSDPVSVSGRRLVFAGDPREAAHAAAARGFSAQVMPLVLQRFPTATFEVPAAAADARMAALAGVNNTLLVPPRSRPERPEGVAALVSPQAPGQTKGTAPPFDHSGWSGVVPIAIAGERSFGVVEPERAIAVATMCCEALARAEVNAVPAEEAASPEDESEGPEEAGEESPQDGALETVGHRWRADYRSWRQGRDQEFERREALERSLVKGSSPFAVQGLCHVCGCETSMHVDFEFGGDALALRPNWRERLVCQFCGLNSKMRGLIHILDAVVVPGVSPRVLAWELEDELTTAMRGKGATVTRIAGNADLPGAEGAGEGSSEVAGASTYDCMLVVDMFERTDDLDEMAARSFALLTPGGGMVFSAAFRIDRERSRLLVDAGPGEARLELGWASLQSFRDAGFEDVVAHLFWSRAFGYLGGEQVVFVARKPGPADWRP